MVRLEGSVAISRRCGALAGQKGTKKPRLELGFGRGRSHIMIRRREGHGQELAMTRLNPVFHPPKPIWVRALPLTLAACLLAGCSTPTPYAPRTEGQKTGYTDRALTQNRYRVTFTGNTVTPRETVESYLLLRAAEVARAAGFNNFVFDTRNTRANTSVQAVPYGPPDPFWGGRRGW